MWGCGFRQNKNKPAPRDAWLGGRRAENGVPDHQTTQKSMSVTSHMLEDQWFDKSTGPEHATARSGLMISQVAGTRCSGSIDPFVFGLLLVFVCGSPVWDTLSKVL